MKSTLKKKNVNTLMNLSGGSKQGLVDYFTI